MIRAPTGGDMQHWRFLLVESADVKAQLGPVHLGRLYSLLRRPSDAPIREEFLCVVPDAHHQLPIADIWSNPLLVLAVEPDAFFDVAIVRGSRVRREGSGRPSM